MQAVGGLEITVVMIAEIQKLTLMDKTKKPNIARLRNEEKLKQFLFKKQVKKDGKSNN